MHESGLMNKWITEQIPMKDKCSDTATKKVDERKVNVADMQGIFFVLFMGNAFARSKHIREIIIPHECKRFHILLLSGVIVAIFLLLCEFYWHRRQVSKRRKMIQPFLS